MFLGGEQHILRDHRNTVERRAVGHLYERTVGQIHSIDHVFIFHYSRLRDSETMECLRGI